MILIRSLVIKLRLHAEWTDATRSLPLFTLPPPPRCSALRFCYYCYFSALQDTDTKRAPYLSVVRELCDLWWCPATPWRRTTPSPPLSTHSKLGKSLNNKHTYSAGREGGRAGQRALREWKTWITLCGIGGREAGGEGGLGGRWQNVNANKSDGDTKLYLI